MFKRFWFLVTLLTLFAALVLPKEYYTGDTILHIPFIMYYKQPTLFTADYIKTLGVPQAYLSVFYPFIASLNRIFPASLSVLLPALHIFYLFGFFTALLLLGKKIAGSFTVGFIASLLLLTHVQIGGAAITTIESEFVPRGISLLVCLFSVFAAANRKYIFVLPLLILAFLTHGLTAFLFLVLWSWMVVIKLKPLFRTTLLLFLLCVTAVMFSFPRMDSQWLYILRLRNSYAFFDLWSGRAWINLGLLLLPGFVVFITNSPKNLKQLVVISYSGSLIFSVGYFLFSSIHPLVNIIVLQGGRIWIFAVVASLFSGAFYITQLKSLALKNAALLLIILVVFGFNLSRQTQRVSGAWLGVEHWAQKTTGINCIFLVPFASAGFRMESERSITGDYKDGTLSFYSKPFAYEWNRRRLLLTGWQVKTEAEIVALRKEIYFDYIVGDNTQVFSFPVKFSNVDYLVYNISQNRDCK